MSVSRAKTGLLAAAFVLGMWPPPPAAHAKRKMNEPNHLIKEKSPYLLQHAYNPVEWFPWGEAAFKKAREENKPILLSIGYSTCHWCHVMERESFSDPKLAALLKKHFVSIKVDREERPDIDKIYMTAVTAMTGSGGWPLNVFLAPDLKPFYGGTYFPPKPAYGRPSFSMVLERIAEDWKTHRKELLADASRMAQLLRQHAGVPGSSSKKDPAWLDGAYRSYAAGFDPKRGGFGGSPKFPMPSTYDFLLRYHSRSGKAKALEMVTTTLREMAKGGIYDHVGGGFHRYATDAEWRVPHFEKMLYDNAQLAATYLDAYQATRTPEFARVARETLEYVLRDMTHGRGGFFSAEDADSLPPELAAKGYSNEGHEHKSEGAFYLWTESRLKEILGKDSAIFIHRYGVHGGGNAPADPHGEFVGKNILYAAYTVEETAKKFGVKVSDMRSRLEKAKETLLAVRARRPRPGLDDKILTSWNGLMISAFAKGAQILGDPRYLEAAGRAASFIRAELYDQKTRRLYRRFRAGSRAIPGLADDYAFLVQGLLDLYEAGFDPDWLDWAVELTGTQQRLFAGGSGGLYMTSEGHDNNLIARVMEDSDGVEPAPSSVASLNLLRLANLTGREAFERDAEKTLEGFGALMRERPTSLPKMLVALDFSVKKPRQIILAGDPKSENMRDLLEVIHKRFIPVKILLMVTDGPWKDKMSGSLPFLKGIKPIKGKATAYVCHDYTCKLPTNDPKVLEKILAGEN